MKTHIEISGHDDLQCSFIWKLSFIIIAYDILILHKREVKSKYYLTQMSFTNQKITCYYRTEIGCESWWLQFLEDSFVYTENWVYRLLLRSILHRTLPLVWESTQQNEYFQMIVYNAVTNVSKQHLHAHLLSQGRHTVNLTGISLQ